MNSFVAMKFGEIINFIQEFEQKENSKKNEIVKIV